MNLLFRLLRSRGSAPVARERLQILLAHERLEHKESDLLSKLREEILVVIGKHISLDRDKVQVKVCLLYTSPSPRDRQKSRMPSSA